MNGSNIISGIHHLKITTEHWQDFQRQYPGSKGAKLLNGYNSRIEWVYKDMVTHPFLTDEVRQGIKREWQSDVFTVLSLNEKVALLNPDQRENLEALIDCMLKGETIEVQY